jgi:hypothetical protein
MKKIFLKLTVLFLISITPVALFNYYIDPYGIFNNLSVDLWYEAGFEPNQHYAKMRHLINDKHSWDSFLFGHSRVGKINPDLIPGGNYYNMNYSEGIPGEHLADIIILLKKGIPIKNVMIGLDSFSYKIRQEDHENQLMRHPYEESVYKRMLFQMTYLYSAPRFATLNNMRAKDNEAFIMNFNILGNGVQNLEKVDKKIEGNIEKHVKSERFYIANIVPFDKASEHKYIKLMDDTIRDIENIIALSKKYHFNLYIFINPTYEKYYLQDNPYYFLLFKEKLAQVTEYWDFSGLNTITSNNYYYYETSHYRIMVGDLIICRMTNCTNMKVPDDFGVFVTRENVVKHTSKQKDRLDEYNAGRPKSHN